MYTKLLRKILTSKVRAHGHCYDGGSRPVGHCY